MKTSILRNVSLAAIVLIPLSASIGCSSDESPSRGREVSHTESNKNGWFGGQVREVNTVYKNDDGSTSVETETRTTRGNTETIVRERKTTFPNGQVKTDRETRTIDKGSNNVQRESKTSN